MASPLLALWGQGSAKEQRPLSALISGRKLPLQLSLSFQATQFHPICPWCPSAGWKSEQVSLSKPVFGSLRESPEAAAALHSLSHSSCWFLQPGGLGTSFLGWGFPCGAGTLQSSGGTPTAEMYFPVFNHHTLVWDQPLPSLHASYQS